jgi:peptide-methionine (R)-S-oxide reductase
VEMAKKYISKSEKEWRRLLTPKEFHILREKGTELPFSGKYVFNKEKGVYVCSGCGNELFSSDKKFDSGSGWPSFWDVLSSSKVELKTDNSLGMKRIEVLCSRCGGHLGHLFNDGPKPTGKRFCINSSALNFKKK